MLEVRCNCPYDWGDHCKHAAAFLLAIRSQKEDEVFKKEELEIVSMNKDIDFLSDYQQLTDYQQLLLKFLALYWTSITASTLATLLKWSGLNKRVVDVSEKRIKKELEPLVSKGYFLKQSRNAYQLKNEHSDALCDQYFQDDPDFKFIANVIEKHQISYYNWNERNEDQVLFRKLRIAAYLNRAEQFVDSYVELNYWEDYNNIYTYWVPEQANLNKLSVIGPDVQAFLLIQSFVWKLLSLEPIQDIYYDYTLSFLNSVDKVSRWKLVSLLINYHVLRGEKDKLKLLESFYDKYQKISVDAMLSFQAGQYETALNTFQLAQKEYQKVVGSKRAVLLELDGIFHFLLQFKFRDQIGLKRINTQLNEALKYDTPYSFGFVSLNALGAYFQNNFDEVEEILEFELNFPLFTFFEYLIAYWIDEKMSNYESMVKYTEQVGLSGYQWIAEEMKALLHAFHPEKISAPPSIDTALLHLIPKVHKWEVVLKNLSLIAQKEEQKTTGKDRLVWLVNFDKGSVTARHQVLNKKGWTKGRTVSLKRLASGNVPGLQDQDRYFIQGIASNGYYYQNAASDFYLNKNDSTWKQLVNHPLLFLEKSPKTAVQLIKKEPTLSIKEAKGGYQIQFDYNASEEGCYIQKESATRYLLIEVSSTIADVGNALNGKSMFIPEDGLNELQKLLPNLVKLVPIESSFVNSELPEIEADSRICLHLLPVGDGFHVEAYVKPFQKIPPYIQAGKGETTLIGIIDGERTATQRDLKTESKNYKNLRKQVSSLKKTPNKEGIWKLEETEQCLQLLTEIKPLVDNKEIILEWPRGEQFKVDSIAGFDNFRMSINGKNNWFEVDGQLAIDEETVLSLQDLLAYSEQKSDFIEISQGKFLALTQEFRNKLKTVNGLITQQSKKGSLGIHPLALPAIESFTEAVEQLEVDQAFELGIQKLKKAFSRQYRVSKSFNATLRPYQKEGFKWLQRCAEWGVGACLADDMGLGKTIQALAVLCSRGNSGPALVVAPASVCGNWIKESEKFAPQLQCFLFGEGDRQQMLDKAKNNCLVVVTYDLLAREEKMFAAKEWTTLILDEAQAIKNQSTKRSAAAMALNAQFKIAMTGTPIENHLGELWNLFNFLNPGLLGSLEQFNNRFALPIEKYKNEERRLQLQNLIKPFILRRKKDEVLKDLPEKTEITLSVDLPPKERAFYEALRRNAIEKFSNNEFSGGQQHLQILAEIMKLRRAACHPSLATKNANFTTGAKLELFGQIVDELLENGHKALVFSQFVDHLKLLEGHLKSKNISYQYLDGSIPRKKRQKSIDAFQQGEGDIFLISLKAGGTGLNLTAADYVIHTDPWWNPAVEDQATDRAHRIGQEKPVTVYRLITSQTIEEKIIELHAQKRDLADSLLAGTNTSAKLSAEELMNLLKAD
ncbi:MAG: DEAD/DEAH box helicase [Bacteroidota bacterium]